MGETMTLTDRLRGQEPAGDPNVCAEAADELEAKDAEIAQLRAALMEACKAWEHRIQTSPTYASEREVNRLHTLRRMAQP